jgi:hypothetical protein
VIELCMTPFISLITCVLLLCYSIRCFIDERERFKRIERLAKRNRQRRLRRAK